MKRWHVIVAMSALIGALLGGIVGMFRIQKVVAPLDEAISRHAPHARRK